jgi:general secretion pathway protein G
MRRRTHDHGFTLLEIMIVVFIVGLLATLVAPRLMGRTDEARRVKATADLATIAQALDLYRLDSGGYPTTPQGLAALVTRPTSAPIPAKWREGGYVDQLPPDPWGNAYVYVATGDRFLLKSLGADGVEGGEGNAADVEHH